MRLRPASSSIALDAWPTPTLDPTPTARSFSSLRFLTPASTAATRSSANAMMLPWKRLRRSHAWPPTANARCVPLRSRTSTSIAPVQPPPNPRPRLNHRLARRNPCRDEASLVSRTRVGKINLEFEGDYDPHTRNLCRHRNQRGRHRLPPV